MKNIIALIYKAINKKHPVKDQERLRREYETPMYDHYMGFGNAFKDFCNMK